MQNKERNLGGEKNPRTKNRIRRNIEGMKKEGKCKTMAKTQVGKPRQVCTSSKS